MNIICIIRQLYIYTHFIILDVWLVANICFFADFVFRHYSQCGGFLKASMTDEKWVGFQQSPFSGFWQWVCHIPAIGFTTRISLRVPPNLLVNHKFPCQKCHFGGCCHISRHIHSTIDPTSALCSLQGHIFAQKNLS